MKVPQALTLSAEAIMRCGSVTLLVPKHQSRASAPGLAEVAAAGD